ncbi:retrovirus-related pol polyprotein from transposon TNT 1-94 [Tanacetum coccineum]
MNSSTIVSRIYLTNSNGLRRLFQLHSSSETTIEGYMDNYKNASQDIRNQLDAEAEVCDVINHQVNVQFLLQLQPEWQRFVTLVKQSQELKTVSYHKLYDILKQHQTSTTRTPEQNGVVERRNHTLVEAAQTMLSAAKVPLYFWAEAIATSCFTQNRSLVIPRHEKTPYHIINGQKPSVKFFYIFGSLCYIVKDGENLDKMKEKGDACIFVGYST